MPMPRNRLSVARRMRAGALALPTMPDYTVTALSIAAAALAAVYVLFIILTVVFATWQTDLAARVRDAEGNVTELESSYYAMLAKENATSPASLGLVAPSEVHYATDEGASGLSYVGR